MITYDHLWWIKSTYDGWRRLKIRFWRKPALTPTKNYEHKTVCVFFQTASDGTVKISRNIARKSKNSEILNLKKIDFSKIDEKLIWTKFYIAFFAQNSNPDPKLDQTPPKTRFFFNFDFYVFYKFCIKIPYRYLIIIDTFFIDTL